MAKCTKLDWQVTATTERIIADLTFDNFDQSMRFVHLLINFLREEKAIAKTSQQTEATTSEHEAPQQGQVSGSASESSGPDGQRPEQANAGSVR